MPETTKTCQVEMADGKPCGRGLYDDEYCIFHSECPDKDKNLLQRELNTYLSTLSIRHFNLNRFIFPDGIIIFTSGAGEINLYNSVFKGKIQFSEKDIRTRLIFGNSRFEGEVEFEHLIFNKEVHFASSRFLGEAWFRGTVFKDKAWFSSCIFRDKAVFSGATFEKDVNFSEAKFGRLAGFFETVFSTESRCKFERTRFGNSADFRFCRFEGDTVFRDSLCEGNTNQNIDFSGSQIGGSFEISEEKNPKTIFRREIDFRNVKFIDPQTVKFEKINLSTFRFSGTDLRQIEFVDVEWDRGKRRNRIRDEVAPDPETKKPDCALIAQLYRCLRANYEENLRYSEAGDFYIGEMEMTRKAEKNIFKKLPLLFYKAISNYGESYYRPLGWIAAILLIFPLLFMFAGVQPVSLDPNNPMQDVIRYKLDLSSTESLLPTIIGDYYTSFLYSMAVFSFIRDKKYTTIDNWGHTLFVLESILSPITLAFFLLALRRRFKR